ncbi:hypothetical protein CgunFtcFv8_024084 [Champsocephalus gunnari]|uniref:Uncharacterized protein n=1 Tax=Champsocephalus gunnari TaxID=52237 RepID=A0AAN8HLH3_CHAGU|nr:hypothetical protein CgunFtcFv8_024084 [Champsocephalus gunnari]
MSLESAADISAPSEGGRSEDLACGSRWSPAPDSLSEHQLCVRGSAVRPPPQKVLSLSTSCASVGLRRGPPLRRS